MPASNRLTAAVLFLAVAGLLPAQAVAAGPAPCVVALVTFTCIDDLAVWPVVLDDGPVVYHVEGRSVQPDTVSIEWSIHTPSLFYLVGCQLEAQDIHVWAVDAAGNHSEEPVTFRWKPGNLRMLDDTNGGARHWRGRRMCETS